LFETQKLTLIIKTDMSKILIIEDEAVIRKSTYKKYSERNDSHQVEDAEDGVAKK
jgi:ribosomal protein S17